MPVTNRNHRKVIGVASDSDLASYEARRSFRFPGSYRKFAKEFGAGMINDYYRISVPYEDRYSLLEMSFFTETEYPLPTNDTPCEPFDRVVLFADDVAGNLFGWALKQRTRVRPTEYAIIRLSRHETEVERVAETFLEFLSEYCFEVPFADTSSDPPETHYQFVPAAQLKRRPSHTRFQTPEKGPHRSKKYQAWLDARRK